MNVLDRTKYPRPFGVEQMSCECFEQDRMSCKDILKTHRFQVILLHVVIIYALEATCLLYLYGGNTAESGATDGKLLFPTPCSVMTCW